MTKKSPVAGPGIFFAFYPVNGGCGLYTDWWLSHNAATDLTTTIQFAWGR